jgi:hypothetical protein
MLVTRSQNYLRSEMFPMLLSMLATGRSKNKRHHPLDILIRRLPVADTDPHGAAAAPGCALRTVNRK